MGRIANIFSGQHITLSLQQQKQMLLLDQEFEALESKVKVLEAENLKLRAEVNPLKQKVDRLQKQVQEGGSDVHPSNSLDGAARRYKALLGDVCDHCGSEQLKRTGNRPDPTFGDLGIKQAVFVCLSCGRESVF